MKLPESWTTVTLLSKILAILLFVSLPFVGFYFGVKYQKSIYVQLDKEMINNIDDFIPEVVNQTTERLEEGESNSSIYRFEDIKVGDKIGGMIINSINPFESIQPLSNENYSIVFKGPITVSGKYSQLGPNGIYSDRVGVCFSDLDEESLRIFPQNVEGIGKEWFCFDNSVLADKEFGITDSGVATIVIDNYTAIGYPADVRNTATLVKVINKNIE